VNTRIFRLGVLLAFAIASSPFCHSLDNIRNLIKPGDPFLSFLPETQTMDIQEVQVRNGKEETRSNRYVYAVDKSNNTFSIVTGDGGFNGVWDAQFLIVKKRRVITDKEMAKQWNLDEKDYYPDPQNRKIIIEEFKDGKKKNTKDMQNQFLELDLDVLTPFLQVMTARGMPSFNADTSMDGFVVNLDFIPTLTKEPLKLTPYLPVPAEAQKLALVTSELMVWSFGANGLIAIVYPDKYYIAFRSTPPYAFVASWGGQKDKAYYTICAANIP
jgi:hypothetical protein